MDTIIIMEWTNVLQIPDCSHRNIHRQTDTKLAINAPQTIIKIRVSGSSEDKMVCCMIIYIIYTFFTTLLNNVYVPRCNTDQLKKSFFTLMVNGWNHRDITIVHHSISGTFQDHHSKVAVGITSAPHPPPPHPHMCICQNWMTAT